MRPVVCEDLSSGLIELLGSLFDVDPRFFRGHLKDHTWYNNRDPWVEMPELDSAVKQRSYFNIQYVQAQYFSLSELPRPNSLLGTFYDVSIAKNQPYQVP